MELIPVDSDALRAVGYDPARRILRVAYRGGGVYDYLEVDPDLFEELRQPHPWHRLSGRVKAHAYRRVDG